MTDTSPRPRRRRPAAAATIGVLAVGAVALAMPAAAVAAPSGPRSGPVLVTALLGIDIPSVSDILRSIANDLFKVLAGAFLPGWLRHAPVQTLRWLIALPDPADPVQWPTMHGLEQDTTSVAVAFLPLTLAIAAARYTAASLAGGAQHPAESLGRLVAAAFGLLVFPWAFANVIAAVNVTTSGLLGFADIDQGLQRALGLMFAGGLLFGVTGPLVALLVIAAILLAAGLFVMKVGILVVFAVLFVAGPLTLAAYPIPELHAAFRLWSSLLFAVAMVPVGWCVIFATAGAISADITHLSTPAAIGTRLVGFFAGILTFFLAFRWPFFLISLVKSRGLLSLNHHPTTSSAGAGGSVLGRATLGRQALLAGGTAAGQALSSVGTAVGMPRGGLAGAGARTAAKVAGTSTAVSYRAGAAVGWSTLRDRAASSRLGRSPIGTRIAAAGNVAKGAPGVVARAASAAGGVGASAPSAATPTVPPAPAATRPVRRRTSRARTSAQPPAPPAATPPGTAGRDRAAGAPPSSSNAAIADRAAIGTPAPPAAATLDAGAGTSSRSSRKPRTPRSPATAPTGPAPTRRAPASRAVPDPTAPDPSPLPVPPPPGPAPGSGDKRGVG